MPPHARIKVPTDHGTMEVDLRNPVAAAMWAWLWPGAGHLYQRRYAKGILFMICVLGTYFFGLAIGGGHVVYASWTKTDKRWKYFFQVGVGIPALPALVQSHRVMSGREPLFGGLMAPPEQPVRPEDYDNLAEWHEQYHSLFELGELFTMIAGLLNVLAIYDALVGPAVPEEQEESDRGPPDDEQKGRGGGKKKPPSGENEEEK